MSRTPAVLHWEAVTMKMRSCGKSGGRQNGETMYRAAAALAVCFLLGGCAATPPSPRPPAQELPPSEAKIPPSGESPPSEIAPEKEGSLPDDDYTLPDVARETGIDRFTVRLETADDTERPALLLGRAEEVIRAAQRFRRERMRSWNVFAFADELHFVAYYELAGKDCGEILERYPESPEAAEAQFTLGLINDYPHLVRFQDADDAYSLTIEKYPGTEAARKAAARRGRLRQLLKASGSNNSMEFP